MACVDAPKIDGQQVEVNQVSMHIAGLSLPLSYLDTIKILISTAWSRCLLLFSLSNLAEAKTNG